VTGQTLSPFAGAAQERKWMGLQNIKTGARVTYEPGDGEITIRRNGAPQVLKTRANFDPKDIGSDHNFVLKEGTGVWKVDHATAPEITAAAGIDPATGKPRLEFIENPVLAALKTTEMLLDLNLFHSRAAWPSPPDKTYIV